MRNKLNILDLYIRMDRKKDILFLFSKRFSVGKLQIIIIRRMACKKNKIVYYIPFAHRTQS